MSDYQWESRWKKVYNTFSDSLQKIKEDRVFGLDPKSSQPDNAVKLAQVWEASEFGSETWKTLNELRKLIKNNIDLVWDSDRDIKYLKVRGYSEAFHMALFGMALDAVNGKVVNGDPDILPILDFGCILLLLVWVGNVNYIRLLKEYPDHNDGFPKKDVNIIILVLCYIGCWFREATHTNTDQA